MIEKLQDAFFKVVSVLFLLVLLPVLFCTFFIGNHMDYYEGNKLDTLVDNPILVVVAFIGLITCIFLLQWAQKIRLSQKSNLILDGFLVVLFALIYVLNVAVAKEIAFGLPYDVNVVKHGAYAVARQEPFGYEFYYSMYPNNIPIAYILGRLYRFAGNLADYPYRTEFFWVQVNCALFSIAGYFTCLTVKKITRNLAAVGLAFILFFQLVAMSAWKVAPYTDTYGIIFPVMAVYFYVLYRETDRAWKKFLWSVLTVVSAVAGGLVKPSIYVILLAILGTELVLMPGDKKGRWKYFLVQALLALSLFGGTKLWQSHVIDEIGLEFNEVISADWHHYFAMGLNEETTGGYNSDYIVLFGKNQYNREDRIADEMAEIKKSFTHRGFVGSLYFYLKKMVMTFNDGEFGWQTEVWADEYYDDLAGGTAFTEFLRNVYWSGIHVGRYNTLCQLLWLFSITGFLGVCCYRKGSCHSMGILMVSFLGIFFYQMFFEARARYLFVFLPLLLVISVCGMFEYSKIGIVKDIYTRLIQKISRKRMK